MLGDRQQFKVGKSKGLDIGDQGFSQGSVIEEATLWALPPGAEMDLIDRHRLTEPVSLGSYFGPCMVLPVVMVRRDGDGRRSGPKFKPLPIRVGLQEDGLVLTVADLEFIESPCGEIRDEKLKYPAAAPRAHAMDPTVPTVKVADHADPFGIGGPDGKAGA